MAGWDEEKVWGYTPRKIAALLSLVEQQRRRECAQVLGIQALAARGDGEAIRKQMRDLER